MRSEPLKDPRRAGKHVAYAIDYLEALGFTDIIVVKSKHFRISFPWGDDRLEITVSCTPRNQDDAKAHFRQALRRLLRDRIQGRGRRH